ncbi:ZIP family metal transporter [Methanococcus voltae]|uniref:Zinc transporter ZupT n=2 Tax=Methanococcus voltae TaxID=2188 RepID=A0A8J7S618_METVO|nr:ZIP family metal transporter [Methanococcus voltae]MBP2173155.1 zinc transporter ZupT [Methanococcus voltae]MBP2202053.1 zinc transporter ZupT [Methanococcus voltae]MCS3922858.1 zinc transporter ZupT [Methanococcus voltae PS]
MIDLISNEGIHVAIMAFFIMLFGGFLAYYTNFLKESENYELFAGGFLLGASIFIMIPEGYSKYSTLYVLLGITLVILFEKYFRKLGVHHQLHVINRLNNKNAENAENPGKELKNTKDTNVNGLGKFKNKVSDKIIEIIDYDINHNESIGRKGNKNYNNSVNKSYDEKELKSSKNDSKNYTIDNIGSNTCLDCEEINSKINKEDLALKTTVKLPEEIIQKNISSLEKIYENVDVRIKYIYPISFFIHAFIDGLVIALTFIGSLGMSLYLAILLHKLPAGFALFSPLKKYYGPYTLLIGSLVSLSTVLGTFAGLWILPELPVKPLISFSAGVFIATSMLLLINPKHANIKGFYYILLGIFAVGIAVLL